MELYRRLLWAGCFLLPMGTLAADFDAATAFGARESVADLRLSPDGQAVSYLSPMKGQGSMLYSLSPNEGSSPRAVLSVSGKEERLEGCGWVSNDRLVCTLSGYLTTAEQRSYFTREVAIDADGKNPKILSDRVDPLSFGPVNTFGGSVIARLPESLLAVAVCDRPGSDTP